MWLLKFMLLFSRRISQGRYFLIGVSLVTALLSTTTSHATGQRGKTTLTGKKRGSVPSRENTFRSSSTFKNPYSARNTREHQNAPHDHIEKMLGKFNHSLGVERLQLTMERHAELRYQISQLVQNSIDSLSLKGGKTLNGEGWVNIDFESDGEQFHVRVEDNGLGIDPVMEAHLYGVLNDKPDLVNRKGALADKLDVFVVGAAGIGLHDNKHFAEGLGGRVFYKNKGTDVGAVFGFSLPLTAMTAETD